VRDREPSVVGEVGEAGVGKVAVDDRTKTIKLLTACLVTLSLVGL